MGTKSHSLIIVCGISTLPLALSSLSYGAILLVKCNKRNVWIPSTLID